MLTKKLFALTKILPYAEKYVLLLTLHMKYITYATNTMDREEVILTQQTLIQ